MLRDRAHAEEQTIEGGVVDGILRMSVHGPLTTEFGDKLTTQVLMLLEQSGARLLLQDFRGATLVEGAVGLIGRVREAERNELLRTARVAVICRVRNNDYAFLEAAANQYGHAFKVFTDGESALRWLREQPPPPR